VVIISCCCENLKQYDFKRSKTVLLVEYLIKSNLKFNG
jgi:hypothetical protein